MAQAHGRAVARQSRVHRRAIHALAACAFVALSCGRSGQDTPAVVAATADRPAGATSVHASCPPDGESPFPRGLFAHGPGQPPEPATVQVAGEHLQAAGWIPLWCGPASQPVFRLTWVPSFGPAVLVETTRTPEDWAIRTVEFADPRKRLDRFAVVRRSQTRASMEDGDDLPGWLRQAGFWSAPPLVRSTMMDGVAVLIEGRSAGGYHAIDRIFTEENFLGETVWTFVRLSGLPMPPDAEKRTPGRFPLNIQ